MCIGFRTSSHGLSAAAFLWIVSLCPTLVPRCPMFFSLYSHNLDETGETKMEENTKLISHRLTVQHIHHCDGSGNDCFHVHKQPLTF